MNPHDPATRAARRAARGPGNATAAVVTSAFVALVTSATAVVTTAVITTAVVTPATPAAVRGVRRAPG
jgi:hypothetical protein